MVVEGKTFKKVKNAYWYKHFKFIYLSLILSYIVIFIVGISITGPKNYNENIDW